MNEKDSLKAFVKALYETPITIIFFILDVVGVIAVWVWVIDDWQEAIVFPIFIIVIFGGQYLVFRRIWQQLARYEAAKPHIEFSQIRQAPIFGPWVMSDDKDTTFEVLQVWFRNNPSIPSEQTIAKAISALIVITKSDSTPLFQYHGQWAESNAPNNVGYKNYQDNVEIRPGYLEAKLFIALKYLPEDECYAFTREGFISTNDGRYPAYKIVPGDYSVKIHLKGIGVDETFPFILHNYGSNQPLKLERQIS
ncbi:MAG: hypothetical protein A2136_04995 [Chloroflexi bacterium RBG_16_54_11]|nr:MAG: hypothetical protein A2136_04995 [Chloroflexi bacterium RBG_16_54_11]